MMSSKPRRTLIRNARVATFDGAAPAGGGAFPPADILIDGARIAAIGTGLEAADARIIAGTGLLAMPGLINAHFHSPANFQKGTLEGSPLEIFMLHEVPPLATAPPSGPLCYVRTMLGAMEMLKLGITAVMDDAFHVPRPTPDSIDGIMRAYRDCGMRATVSLDQPNIVEYQKYPFLKDILPPDIISEMDRADVPTEAELLALYRHLIDRWHGTSDGRIRAAISCSAPQRVTPSYFRHLSALSHAHDLPFIIHMLETKVQRVFGDVVLGKSLIRHVHDLGLLDTRMQVIHAIWIDEDDMRLLAGAGVTVAHNPVCNLKLGSGVMPFRALRDHGVPICLGTDEVVADDSANLWGALKTAALLQKITTPDDRLWPTAAELLDCLFNGGARAMRQPDIGVLRPGAQADIILLDLTTDAFTPLNDLRRQLVFAENGSSVRTVMVAGEIVVENGRLTRIDEAAIRAEAETIMTEFRANSAAALAASARLEPYYRDMVMRCAAHDVGFNRWVGG